MKPRVLLAHSLAWPNVARLSIACRKAGFVVVAIAPKSHPIHRMRSPERTFVYRPYDPRASLRQAIEVSRPQLIIPCDDRIVEHLHALHSESAGIGDPADPSSISTLIETSLGSPKSYEFLESRGLLGGLSGLLEVHVPRTDPINNFRELRDWADVHGLPAVLKLDGSSGGQDVILVSDHSAIASAFLNMRLRRSGLRRLKCALWNQDVEPILDHYCDGARGISVQSFVSGRPANCAIACWRGEVLASVAVKVVRAKSDFGIATVIRPVEGRAMIAAAHSIARHLQLSGMCGLDFVIDDVSKQAKLIEINPRATQINHMPCGSGVDLPTALCRALDGQAGVPGTVMAPSPAEVALFPQEWRRDPSSPYLTDAFHDVPYEEPELIKFYGYEPPTGAAAAFAVAASAVSTNVPIRNAVRSPDAAMTSAANEDAPTSCQAVQLRAGDATAPLFLLPGVDCNVEEVRSLAERLRGDRAVFGLRIDFRTEEAALLATVDQMAAQAVAEICMIQPSGPYYLAGYSFGGIIAFAAAQQLHQSGSQVKLLALIGTPIAQRYWPLPILLRSLAKRTVRHLGILAQRPVGTAVPLLATRAIRLMRLAAQRRNPNLLIQPAAPSGAEGRPGLRGRVAFERYRPSFYPGTLTFLKPDQDCEFFCDFCTLWRDYATTLDAHSFPTNHLGLVSDPKTLGLVAELIQARLGESTQRLPEPGAYEHVI